MLRFWTGVPALTEEDLTKLSPTAAVVAKIVKPGMKLMEVRQKLFLPGAAINDAAIKSSTCKLWRYYLKFVISWK